MRKMYRFHKIHLFESEVLQEYFHAMAKEGWMIKKVKQTSCIFERCNPQDVYFIFDVYDKGNVLDLKDISKQQIAYGELVEEYDYQLICHASKFQLFMSKHAHPMKIHTFVDDDRKKEYEHSIYKYEIYNFLLILICMLYSLWNIEWRSVHLLSNPLNLITFPLLVALQMMIILQCIPFFRWCLQKEKYHVSLAHFRLRETIYRWIYIIIIAFLLCLLAFIFHSSAMIFFIAIFGMAVVYEICFPLLHKGIKKMIKKGHTVIAIALSIWVALGFGVQVLLHGSMLFPSSDSELSASGQVVQESIFLRIETLDAPGYTKYTNKTSLMKDIVVHRLLHNNEHEYEFLESKDGYSIYQDGYMYAVWKDDVFLEIDSNLASVEQADIQGMFVQ